MLLGVNLFLLVLVAGREARSAQYLERARDEAVSILEKNGIAMTAALPREMTLTAMTVTRDAAAEQAQAAGLLGEAAAAEDGAGSYRAGLDWPACGRWALRGRPRSTTRPAGP